MTLSGPVPRTFGADTGRSEGLLSPARGGILAATETAPHCAAPQRDKYTELADRVIARANDLQRGEALPLKGILLARSKGGNLRVAGWDSGWSRWWRGDFEENVREYLRGVFDHTVMGYMARTYFDAISHDVEQGVYLIEGIGRQDALLSRICQRCGESVYAHNLIRHHCERGGGL